MNNAPRVTYDFGAYAASITAWHSEDTGIRRLGRVLYRLGAFMAQADDDQKEMLEIFIPYGAFGTYTPAQKLQPICAHLARVSPNEDVVYVQTFQHNFDVPTRAEWGWQPNSSAEEKKIRYEQFPSQAVMFFRKMRQYLLNEARIREWEKVLTSDVEDVIAQSAKRFAQPMLDLHKDMGEHPDEYSSLMTPTAIARHLSRIFPHVEHLAFASSSEDGLLELPRIVVAVPENGIPLIANTTGVSPISSAQRFTNNPMFSEEDAVARRSTINILVPPALLEKLRVVKIHHEAYWNTDRLDKQYHARMMAVGMLDEYNPGVLSIEGIEELSEVRFDFRFLTAFFVAPLLALPQMQYQRYREISRVSTDWNPYTLP